MQLDPYLGRPFELVRYSADLGENRPILGEGQALWIGGLSNVCDVRMECLSAFASLWGLHITFASIFEMSALRRWPRLKYLAIDGDDRALDLTGFPELEWLSIGWRKGCVLPAASTPLRGFAVWKLPGNDLTELMEWRDLRLLQVVQGRAMTLAGIEKFQQLEQVELAGMRRLRSVAALTACENLRSLHLEACTRVEDLADLRACGALRELVLVRCGSIESLHFLDDMAPFDSVRLSGTHVRDGDMSPLLRMKHARFDYKRGYSHREHEIQQMIEEARGPGFAGPR